MPDGFGLVLDLTIGMTVGGIVGFALAASLFGGPIVLLSVFVGATIGVVAMMSMGNRADNKTSEDTEADSSRERKIDDLERRVEELEAQRNDE